MGRTKGVSLSVPALLNEAQRASSSGHLRYAKMLWELAEEDTQGTFDALVFGLKLFMTVPEKTVYQDRTLRFLGTFASEATSQGRVDFVEQLLHQLVDLCCVKDHSARWRACQLVHAFMYNLPADAGMSDDVADAVQAVMLERLEDGKPNVRAAAVRALARLPMPDEDGDFTECPVVTALIQLLASEKSKDVRKAILSSLPPAPTTAPHLLARTRDESDDVRKVTYLSIAEKLSPAVLSPEERALLVKTGLGDRSAVASEAAKVMLEVWLDGPCQGEPLALLKALGVEQHPVECTMALRCLVDSGRLDAVGIGKMAAEANVGMRRDDGTLMGPEEALFWRVICECLSQEATSKGLAAAATGGAVASIEAAAASDRLEALESALPATVEEIISLIENQLQGGVKHRFAAGQLMALAATCADFTDATGRRAGARLLEQVLSSDELMVGDFESADKWREAVSGLLRKVHSAPAELADAVLSILGRMLEHYSFVTDVEWLHALRVAGMMLENLPSARPALAVSSTVGSLAAVMSSVIDPGMGHTNEQVRKEAVRCMGLYCLLDGIPTPLVQHIMSLRSCLATSSEEPGVRTVAAQALGDFALQRGPKMLDSLLVAAPESGENSAIDPVLASEPTVDLLLDALAAWQRDYTPDQEDLAIFGAAVAESLARMAAVNEFRQDVDMKRGTSSALEDGEVVRLLVALLLVCFDPVSEPATNLRQCLVVFFERFAGLSLTSQQYLATALLPAARTAAADDLATGGKRNTLTGAVAPKLMRFALQLLQLPVPDSQGEREALGHEPLAELLVMEALVCAEKGAAKPYMSALCKLPLGLPMYVSGPETLDTMRRIQVYAAKAAEMVSDRLVKKDLQAIVERYTVREEHGGDPLDEEHIAVLFDGVKSHVEMFCAGYPSPYNDSASKTASRTTTKKAPATRTRKAAAVTVDSSSESESESEFESDDDDVGNQVPENSATAVTASQQDDDESSEDEEEEVENVNMRRRSDAKTRRASVASVAALRKALQENKMTDD